MPLLQVPALLLGRVPRAPHRERGARMPVGALRPRRIRHRARACARMSRWTALRLVSITFLREKAVWGRPVAGRRRNEQPGMPGGYGVVVVKGKSIPGRSHLNHPSGAVFFAFPCSHSSAICLAGPRATSLVSSENAGFRPAFSRYIIYIHSSLTENRGFRWRAEVAGGERVL